MSWLYPFALMFASLSNVLMLLADIRLLDPLAEAASCLAVVLLAVAGRSRHAAVVARAEAVGRRSRLRHRRR